MKNIQGVDVSSSLTDSNNAILQAVAAHLNKNKHEVRTCYTRKLIRMVKARMFDSIVKIEFRMPTFNTIESSRTENVIYEIYKHDSIHYITVTSVYMTRTSEGLRCNTVPSCFKLKGFTDSEAVEYLMARYPNHSDVCRCEVTSLKTATEQQIFDITRDEGIRNYDNYLMGEI